MNVQNNIDVQDNVDVQDITYVLQKKKGVKVFAKNGAISTTFYSYLTLFPTVNGIA